MSTAPAITVRTVGDRVPLQLLTANKTDLQKQQTHSPVVS